MKNDAAKTRRSNRKSTFAPAAWQWDPESLTDVMDAKVQYWTEGGACSLITVEKAREMVRNRVAFCGSVIHICAVHDRIDCSNAPK